jgi:hypothetical protein
VDGGRIELVDVLGVPEFQVAVVAQRGGVDA